MTARRCILPCLILAYPFAPPARAQSTGYIQIECNASADVFLDEVHVGTTSATRASLIVEAGVGRHILEIRKVGYQTQTFSIEVEASKVKQIKLVQFERTIHVGESGGANESSIEQKVGSFRLQTVPVDCTIDVPQLNLSEQRKTKADWFVKDIPIGRYEVTLSSMGPAKVYERDHRGAESKTRRIQVPVFTNRETYLLVNLLTGDIKDIPAEQLLARAREFAARGEKTADWDAWQSALKSSEKALASCIIEPAGAKQLRDRARQILAQMSEVTFRVTPYTSKGRDMPLTWEWNFADGTFLAVESTYTRETMHKLTVLVDGDAVIHRRDISEDNWDRPFEVRGLISTSEIKIRIEHHHKGRQWIHNTARLSPSLRKGGQVVRLSTHQFTLDVDHHNDPKNYWPGDID